MLASSSSCLVVLLDFSSAFDTVSHPLLLQDLFSAGLRGPALDLITSFLTDRSFSFSSSSSTFPSPPCGVPQGSVLGPLLFNIYMTSLCSSLRKFPISYHVYADDVQLLLPLPFPYPSLLDDILSSVRIWSNSKHLALNPSKTEFLTIHPPRQTIPSISLPKSPSLSVRNLGVLFDSSLSFDTHISHVSRTCHLILRNLYTIRASISPHVANSLVTAFIFPRLVYCCPLFISLPKKSLNRLQKILNRACRFVFQLPPHSPTSSFLHALSWLPIRSLIYHQTVVLVYKCLHLQAPSYLSSLLSSCPHAHTTRHSSFLAEPRAFNESAIAKRSFAFSAPRLYNRLPLSVRSCSSLSSFSAASKAHILSISYDPSSHDIINIPLP